MKRAYQRMKRLLRKHDATARTAVIVVKQCTSCNDAHLSVHEARLSAHEAFAPQT